jgi:glucokinase
MRQAMEDNLMPIFRNKVKILLSGMKEADAAVLGASALGWDAK